MLNKFLRWVAGRIGGSAAVQAFDQKGAVAIATTVETDAKDALNAALANYKPKAKSAVLAWAGQLAAAGTADLSRSAIEGGIQAAIQKDVPAAYAVPIQTAVTIALAMIPDTTLTALQMKGVAGVYQIAGKIEAAIDGARF